ncbi:MAG TPA: hypothetical protein VMR28_01210 [Candidatus Saccharimonadales bacterium]|nr:hypothetical protein [Candidatus Saccharimonadales bacterium]
MDLQSVKFVNIFRKDKKGKNEVAIIPIERPQKIRAYIDMGDLQPKNAANNDHGWRVAPEIAAKIRETLDDPERLEQIAKDTTTPLDLINAFHVLMYEIGRNRKLALRAAQNSLDKEQATADYERDVANARSPQPDDDEDDETIPEPSTGKNYTPKEK